MPSKRTIPRVCQWCGLDFLTYPGHVRIGTGKFCSKACTQFARHNANPSDPWKRVLKIDDDVSCWIWTGARNSRGYGKAVSSRLGVSGAHRVIWVLVNGPIPDGLYVLHRCDNPPCVRPDHLFLGTNQDNVDDMVSKNRHAFGERSASAILHESDIPGIRRLIKEQVPHVEIAAAFGVSPATIYAIDKRESWRHVP